MLIARSRRIAAGLAVLVALLAPAPLAQQAVAQQPVVPDARQSLRERILAVAREYADFEWRGSAGNALHGPDGDGTHVDTPDASFDPQGWKPDAANHGMPYAWGGFTSIEQFRAGLVAGQPAGHVPTTERAAASGEALGLDCSGYVARCWDLPVKQSTRSLGALCYPLPDVTALQPGDILNCFDSHVVVFESWLDAEHTRMRVYEAARLVVKASEYSVEALERNGFRPMRYKPLDERWLPMDLRDPSFRASEAEGRWTADGEAAPLAEERSPLRDARPREWTRYRVTGAGSHDATERATLVAAVEGARVDTQTEERLGGGVIATGRSCEDSSSLVAALIDFVAPGEPLSAIEVREASVTPGRYELGGRSFAARRIEARLAATHVVRHQELPVTITLQAVLSPEVPVHGVLEAEFTTETVWRAEPPLIGRHIERFLLQESGAAP